MMNAGHGRRWIMRLQRYQNVLLARLRARCGTVLAQRPDERRLATITTTASSRPTAMTGRRRRAPPPSSRDGDDQAGDDAAPAS